MATEREKIAARIRALRAKTVENGCTEEEAVAAAAKVAELLEAYNMTVDEAEMRESPFSHAKHDQEDQVGTRCLWKIALGIAKVTGVRSFTSQPGVFPVEVCFFGFAHEVEISGYLLDICANALRREQARILDGSPAAVTPRQRKKLLPFLDGMTDRLYRRLVDMAPKRPTGTGLVVLRDDLIARAMEDAGLNVGCGRGIPSRSAFDSYRDGQRAGDKVSLNSGIASHGGSAGFIGRN